MKSEKDQSVEQIKSQIAGREEEILKFWQDNKIFEKSLAKESPSGNFVFYDGPPFATGEPHFGTLLPSTIKDVIPRYRTMQGFHIDRKWGWDCHGLPIENLIEKELGLNNKRDIEAYGIDKFNAAARANVLRFADNWKKIIPRMGRWVDMENDYRTMDSTYTESVWWSFKKLFENKRIYESFKVMQYCPRCGTPLSNFEVNQGYKDITDISVYAKFELVDEPETFLLAWTTTPWTLPGNVALAVNPALDYSKIQVIEKGVSNNYILATDLINKVFKKELVAGNTVVGHVISGETSYKLIDRYIGKELIHKTYRPLFDYYQNVDLKDVEGKPADKNLAWKIYPADFVTTEEGTGIVHMAPAFGDEDFELAKREKLPFIQHVDMAGRFKPEVKDFAGELAKPKEDHQKADVEIIKYLAKNETLFAKEKIIHSYPHCWRCETPLLNYATSSWFVRVTEFKDKLVKINQGINWVPKAIGENRFGRWLEGARDWAISRSRYWGAPIPVWKCVSCHKETVLGSVEDIKAQTKRNNYWIIRHGESENNTTNLISTIYTNPHHLTEKGKEQTKAATERLKDKNIDLIYSSDFIRTTETAEIIKKELNLKEDIKFDPRLREINTGVYEGKNLTEYQAFFTAPIDYFVRAPERGENLVDVRKRVMDFINEIDQKYQNKNILIVSHEDTLIGLKDGTTGSTSEYLANSEDWGRPILNAELSELPFTSIPHNENYELDLHRPYIDEVSWKCECGGNFKRVSEVFDVWYESGSMPYGKVHYPFENKEEFEKKNSLLFPANFIAEGLDQTRGWFYSLLVLGVELFDKSPYQNVIVNGLILAEDGRKMSKSLKNYPDISPTINKFSADALRYFLVSSPAVRAEEVAFSEKGLDEVTKKILNRLQNVVSFYELYKDQKSEIRDPKSETKNVLDQWVIARLNQLNEEITTNLDKYELDKASRPIADFVDDLSTWYLRRSRDRFKSDDGDDKQAALSTTRFVLEELSKLMAPFTPFIAEDIYQRVKTEGGKESVHLENWPKNELGIRNKELGILKEMEEVRKIVSLGLEARAKAGIKVRQPLAELKFRTDESDISENVQYLELIKEEVNVKEAILDAAITEEVMLDTEITPALQEEGTVRELMRAIQDLRKEAGLQVGEKAVLKVSTDSVGESLINKFKEEISKTAGLSSITFEEIEGEKIKIGDISVKMKIRK